MHLSLDPASCEVLSLSEPSNTAYEDDFTKHLEDVPVDTDPGASAFLRPGETGGSALYDHIMAVEIPSNDGPPNETSLEPLGVAGPELDRNADRLEIAAPLGTATPLSPSLRQLIGKTESSTKAPGGAISLNEEVESSATLPAPCPTTCRSPRDSLHGDLADVNHDQDEKTDKAQLQAVRDRVTEQAPNPSVNTCDLMEGHVQQDNESTVSQIIASLRSTPELESNYNQRIGRKAKFVRCEVEAIIDSEVIDSELQYSIWLTKEQGPSCVPADDMDDCDELLAEFHNEHRDKPGYEWAASRMIPRKLSKDMSKQWLHSPKAGSTTVRHRPSVSDELTACPYTRKSPREPVETIVNQYRMDYHPIDDHITKPRAVHKRKRGYGIAKEKRLRIA